MSGTAPGGNIIFGMTEKGEIYEFSILSYEKIGLQGLFINREVWKIHDQNMSIERVLYISTPHSKAHCLHIIS